MGDLVMLTDGCVYQAQWTMAKITAVYEGVDGLVRAADVQVETVVLPKDYKSKRELTEKMTTKSAVYCRPIHKLSLLLAADEVPERPEEDDQQPPEPEDQAE